MNSEGASLPGTLKNTKRTPSRSSSCVACPISRFCAAYAAGDPAGYPRRKAKAERPHRHGVAFLAIARAEPDGHTILLAGVPLLTGPLLLAQLPYDPMRDVTAVATVARSRYILVTSTKVPADNLQALIALAKGSPGSLHYASCGVGSGVRSAAR